MSCAPRPSAASGIGDFGSGAGCCGPDALAITRSVSIICARFLSSYYVSSARLASSGDNAAALFAAGAGGAARVLERDEIAIKSAARSAEASLCDTRDSLEKMNATATSGPSPPKHMHHVGSTLFARALCRKLASEATFSWHLPRCKREPLSQAVTCATGMRTHKTSTVTPGVGPE